MMFSASISYPIRIIYTHSRIIKEQIMIKSQWNMEQSENVRNQKSYGRLKKVIKKYMQYHLQ